MSFRLARTRLVRGISPSSFTRPAQRFTSNKPSTPTSLTSSAGKLVIPAVGVIGSGIWWISSGQDDEVPSLDRPIGASLPLFKQGPSSDEVTQTISRGSYSYPVGNVANVERYDGAQLASNSICEDRYLHGTFPSPWGDGSRWMAWAVFDGHAGWQTAEFLEAKLVPAVRHSLDQIAPDARDQVAVQAAITKAFLDLDETIMKTGPDALTQNGDPLPDKISKLSTAYAGSCALLSIYDPGTSTLYVACTGDSRAVLGQQKPNGKWEATPLSIDQTGSNDEEIARISKDHPGEENIARGGRILGLMVSRAFGDSRWKWSLELQKELKERFNGPSPLTPRYDVKTPPYLTAEPVVTATKIEPGKPAFLIMATDGLWDTLANQQAADLMGKWLDPSTAKANTAQKPQVGANFDFGHFEKGVDWRFVEERTTVQDNNAAVHLMRNSLGGNHHDLLAGRLAFDPPFSRNIRDDITVQVVLFGTQPGQSRKH